MKKIIQFSLFTALFCLLISLINFVLKADNINKNWYQFRQLKHNSIEIFFAGNSRSYSTVQPNIIEDITGIKSYVLGIGGESLQMTYYELQEMFETQSPKLVFLEVFPIYKYESGNKYSLQMDDFFGVFPFYEINSEIVWKLYKSDSLLDIIPIAKYHTKLWKEPQSYFYNFYQYIKLNILFEKPWVIDRYIKNRGYINGYKQLSQESIDLYHESHEIKRMEISPDTQQLLSKIIRLCEKNNSELLLWSVPQYTDFVDQNGIKFDYSKIAKNNNLEFLDLNDYKFELIHYADINHVAPFGSQKASLIISEYLLDYYSDLDNNFMNYYKMITPNQYLYSYDNQGNFIISFTMESALENNNINGIIEINNKKIIGEIINNNEIVFTIVEKPNEEYIKVIFINEDIKHTIEQYVYINYTNGN